MSKKSAGKKIVVGLLIAVGAFILIGILAVVFSPSPEEIAKETEEIRARTESLEQENARKRAAAEEAAKLGIWAIGNFVDGFGEKTGEGYVYNKTKISGVFTNSATKDSPLNVKFIYSKEAGLGLELYEYTGDTPAHILSFQPIEINIQDKDGSRTSYRGTISTQGTRIFFEKNDHVKIQNILTSGGIIKFRIAIGESGMVSSYAFDISNADGFDIALTQL